MSHRQGVSGVPDGDHGHGGRSENRPASPGAEVPDEPGQAAFAAIAEVVELLRRDPDTDWSRVDIEGLRRHLIDMNNVTIRASVHATEISGGARFEVSSDDAAVQGSIRRMIMAHTATMSGFDGMTMRGEPVDGGASMTVTGPNVSMIRGLGFIGLVTLGVHHPEHHLAIARGARPHDH